MDRTNSAARSKKDNQLFDAKFFEGGPPLKLQSLFGLSSLGYSNVVLLVGVAVLAGWLPLAVLSFLQSAEAGTEFLSDFNVHARYLAAMPLLIIAERISAPRMGALAHNFLAAGLVTQADQIRFHELRVSTRRLLNATWVEVLVLALAYLVVTLAFYRSSFSMFPSWALVPGRAITLSPAGWWAMFVSLPLLITLLLSWLWRFCLWARFLLAISKMDLQLVPAHPDGAAGLRFIGYSAQAFAVLALAFGALAAGSVVEAVKAGTSFASHHYFIGFFVAGVVVLLNAPLLVFFSQLLKAWRRGTMEYGALADDFGREFERKWFNCSQPQDHTVLEQQDFSAAADLYQVVDRVYAMWLVPIHLKSVVLLIIASLLPFVPVALMAVPFDVIVAKLEGLIF